jgi:hypothetical protein
MINTSQKPGARRQEFQEESRVGIVDASLLEPEAQLLTPGSWLLAPVFQ